MAFHSSSPGGFISKARWLPMVAGSPGGFPVFPCPPSAGNDSLAGSLAGPRGGSLAEAPREGPWTILLTEAGSGRLHRGSAPRKLKRKGFLNVQCPLSFLKCLRKNTLLTCTQSHELLSHESPVQFILKRFERGGKPRWQCLSLVSDL